MAHKLDRRRFLQLSGAALSAGALSCTRDEEPPPAPGPTGFGLPTPEQEQAMVPAALRPEGVLELFMMGGLSPWDSFYVAPDHGRPERGGPYAGQQWWTYQDGEDSVSEVFARCGGTGDLLQPFGTDEAGVPIHLGPWLLPLRERPDILARMRIVVMTHDLEPHEAAVPLCVTGHPRGSPRLASTGAHVQRFHREHVGPRVAPYSYVLFPNSDTVANFNVEGAAALGTHPGYARPLAIQLRPDNPLPEQLRRAELGGREQAVDAAVDWYRRRFAAGFVPPGAEQAVRSAGLTRFADARAALAGTPQLGNLLTPEILATFGGEACGHSSAVDPTGVGLQVGTHLLTAPTDAARYVHLVDVGLKEGSNGGYDTHNHHVRDASISVTNLSRQLASRINRPGEGDPTKLDLDRHLVVLSTEMGRTPFPQEYSVRGLNHWPYGFVVVLIGGPIDASRAGIVGAIGEDGRATRGFTPAELRAALLLTQGIWPFARESFDVSDVPDASEVAAAVRLRERLLGIA